MQHILNRTFQSYSDFPRWFARSGNEFASAHLEKCYFEHCYLSLTANPSKRTRVRDVRLTGCRQLSCVVNTAMLEDVVVDTLNCDNPLQIRGSVFRRVRFQGKIGFIRIRKYDYFTSISEKEQSKLDAADTTFYSETDWAIDISRAEFSGASIAGIPPGLVVRDAQDQVILERAKAGDALKYTVECGDPSLHLEVETFARHLKESSILLVAGKLSPEYLQKVECFQKLRNAGIVY